MSRHTELTRLEELRQQLQRVALRLFFARQEGQPKEEHKAEMQRILNQIIAERAHTEQG